jgi:hypothetical protein
MNLKKSAQMTRFERLSVLVFLVSLMGWRDYQMGVYGKPDPWVARQKVVLVETNGGNQDHAAGTGMNFS